MFFSDFLITPLMAVTRLFGPWTCVSSLLKNEFIKIMRISTNSVIVTNFQTRE